MTVFDPVSSQAPDHERYTFTIDLADVHFSMAVTQDDWPVEGNAMASGDDAADKACEREILARLDRGDVWAWARVVVRATVGPFVGTASLGGCCYDDVANFAACGEIDQMKDEAMDDLRAQILASGGVLVTGEAVAP